MDKQQFVDTVKKVKESSPSRNFSQSVDLIVNLKNLDMKKPDNNVDIYLALHNTRGKKVKVCAIVGPELLEQAKQVCDGVIQVTELPNYKEKKDIKKLSSQYDYFIAQATIMPKVATAFGRVFGPRGKMPSPKAGCVVPPNANLKTVYDRLQKLVHVQTKNAPSVKLAVGTQTQNEDELIDNVVTAYNSVIHALPNEEQNVKNVSLKLTMGSPVQVGGQQEEQAKQDKK